MANPRFTFSVDPKSLAKLKTNLNVIAKRTGKDVTFVLRDQVRLMVGDFIRRTPPKTQAQGQARAQSDVKRVIIGLNRSLIEGQLAIADDAPDITFTAKSGKVWAIEKVQLDPRGSRIKSFHQSKRRKDGRVIEVVPINQRIGRWRFPGRLVAPHDALDKYLASIADKIGLMKAGWLPAAIRFGAKVPKWVRRHARNFGSVRDTIKPSGRKGYIEITNNTNGIAKHGPFINRAFRNRINAVTKRAEFTIQRILKQQRAT